MIEDLLLTLRENGYRLSHLGESGKQYYACVMKGDNSMINLGRGNTWGTIALEAIENAYNVARKDAERIASGVGRTATVEERVSGEEQLDELMNELFGES